MDGKGLRISFAGGIKTKLQLRVAERRKVRGSCVPQTVMHLKLNEMTLLDAQGDEIGWAACKSLVGATRSKRVADLMRVERLSGGDVMVMPQVHDLPMTSKNAHWFREVGLSLIAAYPELAMTKAAEEVLTVHHSLEDDHHVFRIDATRGATIRHTWSTLEQNVELDETAQSLERAVAGMLGVGEKTLQVDPHPWLMKMRPLWTGKRRWRQSRREYRKLVTTKGLQAAKTALETSEEKLRDADELLAQAVKKLTCERIYKMEAVTACQTQNIARLKHNRLRMWNGSERSYKCTLPECQHENAGGTAHLAWNCPAAQAFWNALLLNWGLNVGVGASREGARREITQAIFGFRLPRLPRWLVRQGAEDCKERWDQLTRTAAELWSLGCAVTLTAIWRYNVERQYGLVGRTVKLEGAVRRLQAEVREAFNRYRLGLYPLNAESAVKLKVAGYAIQRWMEREKVTDSDERQRVCRIGFFDGGSRGNPGRAGSGSVIVEVDQNTGEVSILWAAATALGSRRVSNNVAEFIGLQRLLAHAQSQGWRIHVVGDSALILRMCAERVDWGEVGVAMWDTKK